MKRKKSAPNGHITGDDMKNIVRLMIVAALLVLGVMYFNVITSTLILILGVLTPFFIGGAIAFVLNVPMRQIEKLLFGGKKAKKNKFLCGIARPASLIITLLAVAGLVAVFILVLVPQLKETGAIITQSVQNTLPKVNLWIKDTFNQDQPGAQWLDRLKISWSDIVSSVSDFLKNGVVSVLSTGFDAVMSVISGVANFLIGLVFAVYVLLQKERLGNQALRIMKAVMPDSRVASIHRVASMAFDTFSAFIRGQCLEAVILGLMFVVSMSILRLPYAVLIGILVAVTALIPMFGAFIGCVLGAIMILMVSPVKALIFVILFLVLQQIEGNLIYPHIVGGSIGLPSIWVLVAVTVGGSLMGVTGMLLFIPLCSVAYALLREWVNSRNGDDDPNTGTVPSPKSRQG